MDKKLKMYNQERNNAFELTLSLHEKELERCNIAITEASDKGKTMCYLTVSDGMLTKQTMETIVNEYKFDVNIYMESKFETSIKCYFGSNSSGVITVEHLTKKNDTNVDLEDLYKNTDNYI